METVRIMPAGLTPQERKLLDRITLAVCGNPSFEFTGWSPGTSWGSAGLSVQVRGHLPGLRRWAHPDGFTLASLTRWQGHLYVSVHRTAAAAVNNVVPGLANYANLFYSYYEMEVK